MDGDSELVGDETGGNLKGYRRKWSNQFPLPQSDGLEPKQETEDPFDKLQADLDAPLGSDDLQLPDGQDSEGFVVVPPESHDQFYDPGSEYQEDPSIQVEDTVDNEAGWKTEAYVALAKRQRLNQVKLPWEAPGFSSLFGKPDHWHGTCLDGFDKLFNPSGIGLSDISQSAVVQTREVTERLVEPPVAPLALKKSRKEPVEEDIRFLAMQRLKDFVLQDPLATQLGTSLFHMVQANVNQMVVLQSFSDCFRMKASSTLQKRVASLTRLAKVLRSLGCLNPMRVREEQLYAALCEMRASGAGATSGQHILEGLHFLDSTAKFTLIDISMVVSGRCKGVARDMFLCKDPLSQKHPLSVAMVQHLEKSMRFLDPHLQAICGQILFCIHACCRWKDSQRLKVLRLEKGDSEMLLFGEAISSKTAMTADAKTRFIPYLALGSGITSGNWAELWLLARGQEELGFNGFVLPSFSERSQCWTDRPMSASEASIWLRELLGAKVMPEEAKHFGSHSCKTTILTWVGRCNQVVFTASERRTLGHHLDPNMRSVLCYSRESYTALYSKVLAMYRLIRSGTFNPDLPAVDRVVQGAQTVEAAEEGAPVDTGPNDAIDISDSESSAASIGSIHEHVSTQPEIVTLSHGFPGVPDSALAVHVVSGLIHVVNEDDVLGCGRPNSCNFRPFVQFKHDSHVTSCKQCLKAFKLTSFAEP